MTTAFVAFETSTGSGHCNGGGHAINLAVTITFQAGSGSSFIKEQVGGNFNGLIRVGDTCVASCGHTGTATTGSSLLFIDSNKAVHRIGDTGTLPGGGSFTTTTGSSLINVAS